MGATHNTTTAFDPPEALVTHTEAAQTFIARWQGVQASELSTAQSFVLELCQLLGVDKPHPTPDQAYMFERPVTFQHGDGSTSPGRADCYRRGHFVLEAKKLRAGIHTRGFDEGLLLARSQAEAYARALPAAEGRPPFVLVVDVGTVIEVYAEFSRSGGTYTPFPDPRSHRLALADLARPEVRERLHAIWTAPDTLDPARRSAQVTREVAALLAQLSQLLEQHHPADQVAAFLTRCLFSMFAEDVGLLPPSDHPGADGSGAFTGLLQTHRQRPDVLQRMLGILWADMDHGGFSSALANNVLRFNGKLFKGAGATGYTLALQPPHIDLLIQAAKANWREVEPAIFGTLLERALDPTERHALGAHYTPRAYVERLVLPTVIQPLRAEWANAQAAALVLAQQAAELEAQTPAVPTLPANVSALSQAQTTALTAANRRAMQARSKHLDGVHELRQQALAHIKTFHHRLCTVRVLDPACGSANFLYVTLEHLKRLEGEVLTQAEDLGGAQGKLALEAESVTVKQLLGIELNPRAAALAELVLWIGWLQWHIRTRGNAGVAEPVVHDYGNIQCRDAVLAWERQELATDGHGQPLSRWNGTTFKTHPVTGQPVPDEAAQVPQWRYVGARAADWPQADFIVGNPPFIGNKRMRDALGDGYVQALRAAWPQVPESADLVMYWWAKAAAAVALGQCERMGLITSNSLTMIFNRRVVQAALDGVVVAGAVDGVLGAALAEAVVVGAGVAGGHAVRPVHLAFAVPDHPWVDGANGAAVRIAMTVVAPGAGEGQRHTVTAETPGQHGEVDVALATQTGLVHADLAVGANVAASSKLAANNGLSVNGMMLAGRGFILDSEDASQLRRGTDLSQHLRPIFNGKDLTDTPRNMWVLDFFGFTEDRLRSTFPGAYQRLLERVKPERDQNNRARLREQWWVFAEPRKTLRAALSGLPRYIVTVETAKHRTFQFLLAGVLPEHKLIAIALPQALHLGVLSSEVHVQWALATGGRLGVGNDPVYSKTTCFDTFPFPDEDTGLTPALHQRIATLAQRIDDHRKRALGLPLVPSSTPTQAPASLQAQALASAGLGQSVAAWADLGRAAGMRPEPPPADTPPPGHQTPNGEATQPHAPAPKPGPPASNSEATPQPHAPTPSTEAGPFATPPGEAPTAQPAHKDLTLTNLYNVREALRAGRPLTDKEKTIHTHGLVGVLHSLHTELDAAVLHAYGWADLAAPLLATLSTPAACTAHEAAVAELLLRLVALNTRRTAEEATGTVRWLRPDFQNPSKNGDKTAEKQELLSPSNKAQEPDFVVEKSDKNNSTNAAAQPWPVTLPDQVRAVADALAASPLPLTTEQLAQRFKGKGPWKKSLPLLLQTLQALGRAQPVEGSGEGEGGEVAWRGY